MKQLIIDNEHPNGIIVEVEDIVEPIPYEQRVVNRIREVYSNDDELALHRKATMAICMGEPIPKEFAEYNAYVEKIKEEERGDI